MKIKFTDIPNKLRYSPIHKGRLSTYHSSIIEYVCNHFQDTRAYKNDVISIINKVSYIEYCGDSFPNGWSSLDPFSCREFWDNIHVDSETKIIKDIFIQSRDVIWDIEPIVENDSSNQNDFQKSVKSSQNSIITNNNKKIQNSYADSSNVKRIVCKSDLSIQPPKYARFDVNKVWKSGLINNVPYIIYESIPEVPTTQREISITTDVSKMTIGNLLNLFPNERLLTRYASLYTSVNDISYDDILGCITPIAGFTEDQVRDNIIRYPHFFKLKRVVDGKIVNFYNTIEINGELHRILDVWEDLPESSVIPRQFEFIKDYVVRRYLLERDILHIEHKYPIYGSMDPFLTLFTTPKEYKKLGYEDPIELAKQCVSARVNYKASRNPIVRRLEENV